jgi:hypothetical protein
MDVLQCTWSDRVYNERAVAGSRRTWVDHVAGVI